MISTINVGPATASMPHKLNKTAGKDPAAGSTNTDCTICWSSSGCSVATYSKTKSIRLHRSDPSVALGFSIRGGWEHGIGFYVSEVQSDSVAAKNGLTAGDQIIRINGFPLDRVTHDEVIALIRMSTNDLTLRVRSTGIVPHRGRPGEKLTWKRLCTQRSEGSSEASSFIYARPRSASSSLTTPPSSASSEDRLSSDDAALSQSNSRAIYCSKYNQKHLFIQCHQPGSSLGCSVVNGPISCPGIFIQNVKDGKLAQKCGLEVGDQIVKVNNVDVSVVGFDGAISLLKSMTNLSLLVRKGVAKHIFECREQYATLGGKQSACHLYSSQYQCSKSYVNTSTVVPIGDSGSSASDMYTLPAAPPPPPPPSVTNPYAYYHHQYNTISTAADTRAPPPPLLHCQSELSPRNFCSSYSTMKIACENSLCCCKRKVTGSGTEDSLYSTATSGMCTLVMNGRHPEMILPTALIADNGHLDTVTSAMANSIRILQEVREKEEKLVEASRKLNEEHLKLCREKEKLENEKKELTERSKDSKVVESEMIHFQQQSLFAMASGGNSSTAGSSIASSGPSFSFLEEIKALGENGGKRHLRPVNSNAVKYKTGSNELATDEKSKLRRLPFGLDGHLSKETADKKRQHELLMEEFRIAHQRMFGGNNSGSNSESESGLENKENTSRKVFPRLRSVVEGGSQQPKPPPPPPPSQWNVAEPVKSEESLNTINGSRRVPKSCSRESGSSSPGVANYRPPPPPPPQVKPEDKRNPAMSKPEPYKPSGQNRITIKVLSPKIQS